MDLNQTDTFLWHEKIDAGVFNLSLQTFNFLKLSFNVNFLHRVFMLDKTHTKLIPNLLSIKLDRLDYPTVWNL